ncbi:putative membrane protein [Synechococcus sp. PCC 7502]|uniref:DoxX family protein n=1 Tax=Synechococcus sp. PCC 7502 TaxID=1173263 RepID=UPI00029FAB28|nr:DoxX family protein [Synechococcus sp. PCC 7502]AFY74598.1 putative membrane protein [Synechococcus sp. PCC 7502]
MNNAIRITGTLATSLFRSENAPQVLVQVALTMLRVVAGIVMIHNGLDKISDIEGFAEAYVAEIGLPFPVFFSYVAALTELIGAPLLVLGLLTRPAALGLMSTMLVAIYHHVHVGGFSIPSVELSTLYSVCFAFFVVNGAGKFSVDQLISDRFFPQPSINLPNTPAIVTSLEPKYVKSDDSNSYR